MGSHVKKYYAEWPFLQIKRIGNKLNIGENWTLAR